MSMAKSISSATPPVAAGGGEKTIIPYLFGGLGLLLALIAIALIVLAFSSRKKHLPPPPTTAPGKFAATLPDHHTAVSDFPRIVVIMAGDDKPTYLAAAAPVYPPPLPVDSPA